MAYFFTKDNSVLVKKNAKEKINSLNTKTLSHTKQIIIFVIKIKKPKKKNKKRKK